MTKPAAYLSVNAFVVDDMPEAFGPSAIWGVDLVLGDLVETIDGSPDIWTAFGEAKKHSLKSGLPILFEIGEEGERIFELTRENSKSPP